MVISIFFISRLLFFVYKFDNIYVNLLLNVSSTKLSFSKSKESEVRILYPPQSPQILVIELTLLS